MIVKFNRTGTSDPTGTGHERGHGLHAVFTAYLIVTGGRGSPKGKPTSPVRTAAQAKSQRQHRNGREGSGDKSRDGNDISTKCQTEERARRECRHSKIL